MLIRQRAWASSLNSPRPSYSIAQTCIMKESLYFHTQRTEIWPNRELPLSREIKRYLLILISFRVMVICPFRHFFFTLHSLFFINLFSLFSSFLSTAAILTSGFPNRKIDRYIDAEVKKHIVITVTTTGRLTHRFWENPKLTTPTKIPVYNAYIISTLLHGSETWTTYAKQERMLNSF